MRSGPARIARRYAPFLALAVVQLLIIVLAPSKAPTVTAEEGADATGSSREKAADRGVPTEGDTSHCVDGRQFGDLKLGAPPCIPRFTGENGGATAPGVTATTVKVVVYQAKENPTVTGVLRSFGLNQAREDERAFLARAQTFINDHYELYGRKVEIDTFEGNCEVAPPDVPCLRNEAQTMVKSKKPFAVIWGTTVAPEFFDELSRAKVVNMGGWHFNDSFNVAHRPYHYDLFTGGSQQAKLAGEYWCKKLANKPARYAGDPTLRTKPRKLGIVTPDFEVTRRNAEELADIVAKCDRNEPLISTYASDTGRAGEQSSSATARFKAEGVTSVMYFSDPIGPVFGTASATRQGFFPEYPMAGSGLVDYDLLARLYDKEQWKNAFGVSDLAEFGRFEDADTVKVWQLGGGQGLPNKAAQVLWSYLSFVAGGLTGAGPDLTPAHFEEGLLASEPSGGWEATQDPTSVLVKFGKGDYTAVSDAREVYWDPTALSKIDGQAGAFVSLNGGRRYELGQWTPDEPQLPGR